MKTPMFDDAQRSKYLVRLAEILFELAQCETDQVWLKTLRETTLSAKNLFDKAENELHPDLGFTLDEYVLFKLDGKHQEGMADEYAEELRRILAYVQERH